MFKPMGHELGWIGLTDEDDAIVPFEVTVSFGGSISRRRFALLPERKEDPGEPKLQ